MIIHNRANALQTAMGLVLRFKTTRTLIHKRLRIWPAFWPAPSVNSAFYFIVRIIFFSCSNALLFSPSVACWLRNYVRLTPRKFCNSDEHCQVAQCALILMAILITMMMLMMIADNTVRLGQSSSDVFIQRRSTSTNVRRTILLQLRHWNVNLRQNYRRTSLRGTNIIALSNDCF